MALAHTLCRLLRPSSAPEFVEPSQRPYHAGNLCPLSNKISHMLYMTMTKTLVLNSYGAEKNGSNGLGVNQEVLPCERCTCDLVERSAT